jgi:hypothetical protein
MVSDALQPRAKDEFAVLTDGVIVLQCLDEDDAEAHLAGEDGDQIRWLAGGPASMERLLPWIRESREQWKSGGPRRHFGIRDVGTHQLIGNAEANLQLKGSTAGEVNIHGRSRLMRPRGR